MAGPLTFLRPFRHGAVRSILLLESAPIDLTLRVAERLQEIFPESIIELVVREDDRDAVAPNTFTKVHVVRWEDRVEVVRRLRRRPYDAVVVPTSDRGSEYLRTLAMLLRARAILVFNERMDWFPLHAIRLGTLAYHLTGQRGTGALLRWIMARTIFAPPAIAILVATTLRLEMRAWWRRMSGATCRHA